ncbi:spermidine/putrescine transport system permease protein [Friedmanniella luteola]|uniref:Spermidine/putrescine transport system permease protein n=1 Tax=Friedmanniella luteola TaxID=546871 RepID=A0A1H1NEC6_9ACTN|nr:ABC transporter permease [Friedmanniella luteola]SDR97318.1 spermidine/putrescine transport system permease protein [Friedmanniella luteola]
MAVLTRPAARPGSPADPAPPAPRRRGRASRWVRDHLVTFVGLAALAYLFVPIVVVVVFSFNAPEGSFNYTWNEFSVDAWANPCSVEGLCASLVLSIKIALLSTLAAVVLGTLAAFALVRHEFRGKGLANVLIFVPMATPEVVAGSSLLVLFVGMGFPLGQATIFIAHTVFCMSFVVVTVKARLVGLDPRLEQAAQDLYADRWQTFWRITFPLILPGVVAAALLSFSLSFDDFIITNFNSGSEVTFPMYVWGAAKKALPPQINVVGTAMLLIALVVTIAGRAIGDRRAAR